MGFGILYQVYCKMIYDISCLQGNVSLRAEILKTHPETHEINPEQVLGLLSLLIVDDVVNILLVKTGFDT